VQEGRLEAKTTYRITSAEKLVELETTRSSGTEQPTVAADNTADHHPARVAGDRGPRLRLSQ